jgi:hypothetical protein
MSTSILYHCFGVMGRGIHHVHTRFEKGRTVFGIDQDPTTLQCSWCGSRAVKQKGTVRRTWMTLPIGLRQTLINDRLELTGMRWVLKGAESVIRLRAVFINKDWADFWGFRRNSERTRLYGTVEEDRQDLYGRELPQAA